MNKSDKSKLKKIIESNNTSEFDDFCEDHHIDDEFVNIVIDLSNKEAIKVLRYMFGEFYFNISEETAKRALQSFIKYSIEVDNIRCVINFIYDKFNLSQSKAIFAEVCKNLNNEQFAKIISIMDNNFCGCHLTEDKLLEKTIDYLDGIGDDFVYDENSINKDIENYFDSSSKNFVFVLLKDRVQKICEERSNSPIGKLLSAIKKGDIEEVRLNSSTIENKDNFIKIFSLLVKETTPLSSLEAVVSFSYEIVDEHLYAAVMERAFANKISPNSFYIDLLTFYPEINQFLLDKLLLCFKANVEKMSSSEIYEHLNFVVNKNAKIGLYDFIKNEIKKQEFVEEDFILSLEEKIEHPNKNKAKVIKEIIIESVKNIFKLKEKENMANKYSKIKSYSKFVEELKKVKDEKEFIDLIKFACKAYEDDKFEINVNNLLKDMADNCSFDSIREYFTTSNFVDNDTDTTDLIYSSSGNYTYLFEKVLERFGVSQLTDLVNHLNQEDFDFSEVDFFKIIGNKKDIVPNDAVKFILALGMGSDTSLEDIDLDLDEEIKTFIKDNLGKDVSKKVIEYIATSKIKEVIAEDNDNCEIGFNNLDYSDEEQIVELYAKLFTEKYYAELVGSNDKIPEQSQVDKAESAKVDTLVEPTGMDWLKRNAIEGAYQGAAKTAVNSFIDAIVAAISTNNPAYGAIAKEFVKTDAGFALASGLIGMGVHMFPMDEIKNNEHMQKIADKCAQNAAATGIEHMSNLAINFVVPALKAAEGSIKTRVAIPQTATKSNDVDELAELEAISNASAKRAK